MTDTFQLKITIPPSAIDKMGHVNNVQYLQWIQDVAEAHWINKSTDEILQKFAWVALDHHIHYFNPSYEGEDIIAETWVSEFSGVKSIRKTKIFRPSDNKTLVEATTQWCLLTMPQGKPTRIPTELSQLYEND
tara:strand:- start:607 stop:1005 length:399 start_codon:yes stop_codon:yes gene_type:complete